jgi:hypothetical protein
VTAGATPFRPPVNDGVTPIPLGLRALFDAGGPVLKLRVVRDLLGRDESYLDTAELARAVRRLPDIHELIAAQRDDGSWRGSLHETTVAMLRLCECGLESSVAVQNCIDTLLLPSLAKYDPGVHPHEDRDIVLYLLARAQRPIDALVKPQLETVLVEMESAETPPAPPLKQGGEGHIPLKQKGHQISMHAYAAVCCYPWDEDDSERVNEIVRRLHTRTEEQFDERHDERLFGYWTKEHYLANPERLFYELELSARLGITHTCDATRWMFDEVEARQDADGWVRFEDTPPCPPVNREVDAAVVNGSESVLPWYYPLESRPAPAAVVAGNPNLDWTFRAALVFKMLEYDF